MMRWRGSLSVALVASLAGLLFGFDTAVISGVIAPLRQHFMLSPGMLGAAVSSALWGTLLGALLAGRPGDRFGSRDTLKLIGVFYLVCAVGCALCWSLASFMVFRFIGGLAIGGSSVLAPVYIAELAPAARRGARVGLFQFNVVLGILVAYLSNFLLAQLLPTPGVWRVQLLVAGFPAALFLGLLFTIPQSPRWLAIRKRYAEAREILRQLGSTDPAQEVARYADDPGAAGSMALSWPAHRRPIVLAITLALFNQLSGINAILYYLNDIFGAAGYSQLSASLQAVLIGGANLLSTAAALLVIDRLGRRPLLMAGAVGTSVALGGVALIMQFGVDRSALLPLLILFIVSFAFSQGAVIWVYLSEIFPAAVRARGQGLGSATHWIVNAVIAMLFPLIAATTKALPFAIFALCMLLQLVVVWAFFPETRGVTLESMAMRLRGPTRPAHAESASLS